MSMHFANACALLRHKGDPPGGIRGVAYLISDDVAVTCPSVLSGLGEGSTVHIQFPTSGTPHEAEVLLMTPRSAFLRVADVPPGTPAFSQGECRALQGVRVFNTRMRWSGGYVLQPKARFRGEEVLRIALYTDAPAGSPVLMSDNLVVAHIGPHYEKDPCLGPHRVNAARRADDVFQDASRVPRRPEARPVVQAGEPSLGVPPQAISHPAKHLVRGPFDTALYVPRSRPEGRVREKLNEHRTIVIAGPPGSGKRRMAERMERLIEDGHALEGKLALILRVRLGELASSDERSEEAVVRALARDIQMQLQDYADVGLAPARRALKGAPEQPATLYEFPRWLEHFVEDLQDSGDFAQGVYLFLTGTRTLHLTAGPGRDLLKRLFGRIESWVDSFPHLHVMITHTTEPQPIEVAESKVLPSPRVELRDFEPEEVEELGRILGVGWTSAEIERLHPLIERRPLLVAAAMGSGKPFSDVLSGAENANDPFLQEHMDYLCRGIADVKENESTLCAVVHGRPHGKDRRSFHALERLRNAGVLTREVPVAFCQGIMRPFLKHKNNLDCSRGGLTPWPAP